MQSVTVGQVCEHSQMQAIVLPETTSLDVAIRNFATDLNLRGIFLTDTRGRLSGVINKQDILSWVRIELALPPQTQAPAMSVVRRLVLAETVGDLARSDSAETAVSLDDSLAAALDKMTRHDLTDIPVVDEMGRIVNDLRLSEILAYVLQDSVMPA